MYNIHKKIPQEVNTLYAGLGFGARCYVVLRWMLSHFEEMERHIPNQAKVLDVGCGYGLFANFISLKSDKRCVIGLDNSHKRISIASRSSGNRKNLSFVEGDIVKGDITSYDVISFSDVLHHFSYNLQKELFEKIYKQIKPGALVLIKELDTKPFVKYFISYMLDTILYLGQTICYRSASSWKNMLNEIGFDVEIIPLYKNTILSSILCVCKKR